MEKGKLAEPGEVKELLQKEGGCSGRWWRGRGVEVQREKKMCLFVFGGGNGECRSHVLSFSFFSFSSSVFFYSLRLSECENKNTLASLSPSFFPCSAPPARCPPCRTTIWKVCLVSKASAEEMRAGSRKRHYYAMVPFGAVDRWLRSSSFSLSHRPSLFSPFSNPTKADYGFEYSDEEVDAEDADLENDYYNSKGEEEEN